MNNISKFQKRLKNLRKENSITQQELANTLGFVRTAIANYETGRTSPDIETLNIIANIFKVSIDYLLGKTDIKEPIDKVIEKKELDIFNQIHNLSPESQKDLNKYIELLMLKEKYSLNNDNPE